MDLVSPLATIEQPRAASTRSFRFSQRWWKTFAPRAGPLLVMSIIAPLFVLLLFTWVAAEWCPDEGTACEHGILVVHTMLQGANGLFLLLLLCTILARTGLGLRRRTLRGRAERHAQKLRQQSGGADPLDDPDYGPLHHAWADDAGPDLDYRRAYLLFSSLALPLAVLSLASLLGASAAFDKIGTLITFDPTEVARQYRQYTMLFAVSTFLALRSALATRSCRRAMRQLRETFELRLGAAESAFLRRHAKTPVPLETGPAMTYRPWSGALRLGATDQAPHGKT